jgi:hypothetical protein
MKHILALCCLVAVCCLMVACKHRSSQTSGIDPSSTAAAVPAIGTNQSYLDDKGLPSGTFYWWQPQVGSKGEPADIYRALTVNSASVTYSPGAINFPMDAIYADFEITNHTGKPLNLLELRISFFDETGNLLTQTTIETDEDERAKSRDGQGKYFYLSRSDLSGVGLRASYFSELYFASSQILVTIGDPIPTREFDQLAEVIRRNGVRIRVEPLQLSFKDGTVLTGVR